MNKEFKRMQNLAGVPVTEDKSTINENFVGIPAINNPFADREKTDYEMAFEHFLGEKYGVKEKIEGVKEDELEEDMPINEGGASLDDIYDYFEIMIAQQPDAVLDLIMNLIASEGRNFDQWMSNIADDVMDTLGEGKNPDTTK
jgi:hypothetical protein